MPSPQGRQGDLSITPLSALFRGPLPFQTLLPSLFVSVFGVSGLLDSISRPEVQKPPSIGNRTTGPSAAPPRGKCSAARHAASQAHREPPARRASGRAGVRRDEAVTFARPLPPRSLPSRARVATPAPAPPKRGQLTHPGLRGGDAARDPPTPEGGVQGPRRPHSPLRPLAARARTPPRPGAPSAEAAGEGDGQVYPGSRPGLLPPACPPPRR